MNLQEGMNRLTGQPITTNQQLHLKRLDEAAEALYQAMHDAEGSTAPGEHQDHVFMGRRMVMAAGQIEIALMLARKAALEAR